LSSTTSLQLPAGSLAPFRRTTRPRKTTQRPNRPQRRPAPPGISSAGFLSKKRGPAVLLAIYSCRRRRTGRSCGQTIGESEECRLNAMGRVCSLSRHGLFLAIVASWLGISVGNGQQTKPTDEDIDRAIHACSLGKQTDTQIEGGLSLLKHRILTGEGKFSQSEIPSVIGSAVQTDDAKITLFDRMQKCVIQHMYGGTRSSRIPDEILPGFAYFTIMQINDDVSEVARQYYFKFRTPEGATAALYLSPEKAYAFASGEINML